MNQISASIIADSLNEHGQRLTTFVLTFPRIILAEFNTHRMISRNSASSRAIPFVKMLKKVQENPFVPIAWQKDHVGMQGTEYFSQEEIEEYGLLENHLFMRDCAVQMAKTQSRLTKLDNGKWLGLTKQIVNRYLEPFLYHTVICTGTEWENFFALRAHPAAEIHIADLADKMLAEYNASEPRILKGGEWHIPFGDRMDESRIRDLAMQLLDNSEDPKMATTMEQIKVMIATARCARVSYDNFDGTDDYNKDVELYNKLSSMGHYSPFEHCARAMTQSEMNSEAFGWFNGWCGNFKGFVQLRKTLKNENKKDPRVLLK